MFTPVPFRKKGKINRCLPDGNEQNQQQKNILKLLRKIRKGGSEQSRFAEDFVCVKQRTAAALTLYWHQGSSVLQTGHDILGIQSPFGKKIPIFCGKMIFLASDCFSFEKVVMGNYVSVLNVSFIPFNRNAIKHSVLSKSVACGSG